MIQVFELLSIEIICFVFEFNFNGEFFIEDFENKL